MVIKRLMMNTPKLTTGSVVVDSTPDEFVLLQVVDKMGKTQTQKIRKADMAKVHDQFEGGNDIAYLSKVIERKSVEDQALPEK
jgi:hypothetical protein